MVKNTIKKNKQPIIVTGAAGFIGMHVSRSLLARGERVIGFDAMTSYNDPALKRKRLAILKRNIDFSFRKGSLTDAGAFKQLVQKERPRAIIHLAAQAGVRYSQENPQSYIQANILGSLNVFEAARERKIPVVYASSSSVYGEREGTFKESDPTDSQESLYAATKKSVEVIAENYSNLYAIPLTGLRFFTVYGPWMRTDLAIYKFSRLLLLGKVIPLYAAGKGKRSYTHISLVVDGTLRAIDRIKKGHTIYNLGDENTHETKKMLSLLSSALGVRAKTQLLPHQKGDVMMTSASGVKAKRELGVEARVPLRSGIQEFSQWFLEHKEFLLGLKDMHS